MATINTEKNDSFTIQLCYAGMALTNLMNFIVPVPVLVQLLVQSLACIYIASYRGAMTHHRLNKDERIKVEKMSIKDACLLPVIASCVLFGFYIAYENFDKDLFNRILTVHLGFFEFLSLLSLLAYHLETVFPQWNQIIFDKNFTCNLPVLTIKFQLTLKTKELVGGLIAIIPTIAYFTTKHWLLSNLFSIALTICIIERLLLLDFKVGFTLLWGFFFYDIFWVYETYVQLTVSKSMDAPIRLMNPIALFDDPPKFAMLDLKDIVIPGVFVAFCLKYDIHTSILNQLKEQAKELDFKKVKTTYFTWVLVGYALGIVAAFSAMMIFVRPQPTLGFVVPGCTGAFVLCALKNKQIREVFNFHEGEAKEQAIEEKIYENTYNHLLP